VPPSVRFIVADASFHCRVVGGDVRLSDEHDVAEWVPV
jgi:hypothetical protein